jgi:hypothetical protein
MAARHEARVGVGDVDYGRRLSTHADGRSEWGTVTGHAFFTSIPKCGKNLVTMLFEALGIARIDHPDEQAASAHVMARWTQTARAEGRLLQPGYDDATIDAYIDESRLSLEVLTQGLESIPDGHYVHAHLAFDAAFARQARAVGVPLVFVYRDPRAMVASQAYFLVERGEPSDLLPRLGTRTLDAAYRLLIEGDDETLDAQETFAAYRGWLTEPHVLPVRFEDLVGPRGGGSASAQLATVARIAQHIGWRGAIDELLSVAQRVFSPAAGTFRRGTIDGWRGDVTPEIAGGFPKFFVDLPREWGYPVDPSATGGSTVDDTVSLEASTSMRAELDRAVADGDERLELIHKLRGMLDRAVTDRNRLAQESDERLALVHKLNYQLSQTTLERDNLGRDGDDRLTLIHQLQDAVEARDQKIGKLWLESHERLLRSRASEARLQRLQTEHERVSHENNERLAVIRRVEEKIAATEVRAEQVASDSDERLAVIRRREARMRDLESQPV